MVKILQKGAEAVIYLDMMEGETVLVKDRLKKGYRLPELDRRIRERRTTAECSLLSMARRCAVPVPRVFDRRENRILMDFIDGDRVKDILNSSGRDKRLMIYRLVGEAVGKMHSNNLMHGDLTTSNMILKGGNLFIIDFGLGKVSAKAEDKATDIYLLFEALKAAHFRHLKEAWKNILNTYKHNYSNSAEVMSCFEKISERRRYK